MTQLRMTDWGCHPAVVPVLLFALLAAALSGGAITMGMPAWRALVLLLAAPMAEEVIFRAGVHDGLLHNGIAPWLANLLTALVFSTAHMLLLGLHPQTALVLFPALLIGAAYNRWHRVRICIALHMAMNALWIAAHGLS